MRVKLFFVVIIALLLGPLSSRAEDAPKQVVWMRADGQRITGNAKLEQQDSADRAACLALAQSDPSAVFFGRCMAAKGYLLVPLDEAPKRLAEAAAARAAKQKNASLQLQPKKDDGQIAAEPGDSNENNRRLIALSEKDRRWMFHAWLNLSGESCQEIARTFYKGSEKPSWNAIWNIECRGGPSYSILVRSDEKRTAKVMTCGELRAAGGGECFVRSNN
jgi:hypothetical protein